MHTLFKKALLLKMLSNHLNFQWVVIFLLVESGSESHSVVSDSCYPLDYTVHGILQPRILKWVAFLFSRESPDPGIELGSPAWQVDCLPTELAGCWWKGLKYFDSTQNVTWIHKVSKCCSKTELIDVLNAKLSQPSIKKKNSIFEVQ